MFFNSRLLDLCVYFGFFSFEVGGCIFLWAQGFAHRVVPMKRTHTPLQTCSTLMTLACKKTFQKNYSRPACGKLTKSKWRPKTMVEKNLRGGVEMIIEAFVRMRLRGLQLDAGK